MVEDLFNFVIFLGDLDGGNGCDEKGEEFHFVRKVVFVLIYILVD